MATLVQAVRFTAGLAMIAGGAVLVAPVVSDVMQRASERPAPAASAAAADAAFAAAASMHAIPDPRAVSPADSLMPAPAPLASAQQAPEPYRPPAPPAPLPSSFPGVVPAGTALDATYRSTVRVPPPPLLDAHGPPPVAPGWTAREPARKVAPVVLSRGDVPSAYIVRDGDDLTALAIRFYGHPGAAAAILAANRDVLERPDLLPIGTSIRLPPPWTVSTGLPPVGPHTIEPGPASDRGPASGRSRPAERGRSQFSPVPTPQPWLTSPGT